MSEILEHDRIGELDVLRLNTPNNRNALSLAILERLIEGVERSEGDPGARGIVLDHRGPAFCSGLDLRERRTLAAGDDRHTRLFTDLLTRLWNYPRPVVARINGPVRAGGMGLLACADLAVASADVTFAFAEVRVGVVPALVGALALLKVPAGRMTPWLITGEPFTAHQALELGLVSHVVDDPSSTVDELADQLRLTAPGAVAATKQMVREVTAPQAVAVLEAMGSRSNALFETEEAREGLAAFVEKRPASWATTSPRD